MHTPQYIAEANTKRKKTDFGYFKLVDILHKKSDMCEDQLSEFQTCPCKTQKLAHLKRVEMLIGR